MIDAGRCVRFGIFAIVLVALVAPATAAPWGRLALFKKIDADPGKTYSLKDTNGPWMILANTFRGPDADRRAKELTYELRKKFKLEAYSYSKEFDYRKSVNTVNRFGVRVRGRYAA